MRILMTGFGPYGLGANASEMLIEKLRSLPADWRPADVELDLEVWPTDTEAAPKCLYRMLADPPSYLLCFGQAPGRNRITIETTAINLRDFALPDAAGRQPRGEPIVVAGPGAYFSNLPDISGLVGTLNNHGIPAAISNHAGTHLCNQILYTALHEASMRLLNMSCGFIHIPISPEQIIANETTAALTANCAFMPTDMVVRAVKEMVLHLRRFPEYGT